MNINDILLLKFPEAFLEYPPLIGLRDDGDGIYIKYWNLDINEPSDKEIKQWGLELEQKYLYKQNKILNEPLYQKLKDIDEKSIRALRVNDLDYLQELEQQAIAVRAQLLPTE